MGRTNLTLPAVVIDIRVGWMMPDRLIEALEGFLRISLLHMHAGYLYKTLGVQRDKHNGFLEIGLRTFDVAHKEPNEERHIHHKPRKLKVSRNKIRVLEGTP